MWAAWAGVAEMARLLLAAGADIHAKEKNGVLALQRARDFGHADIVELLIQEGADLASGCLAAGFR